jgi:hypothetical protein
MARGGVENSITTVVELFVGENDLVRNGQRENKHEEKREIRRTEERSVFPSLKEMSRGGRCLEY